MRFLHFEEADVFHMGDNFFNGFYPFVDVSSNGDINGIISTGYRVLAMSNAGTQIIPGHGPLATADDLRDWLQVLRSTRESIQELIDQGMSEDEVVAANPDRRIRRNARRWVHEPRELYATGLPRASPGNCPGWVRRATARRDAALGRRVFGFIAARKKMSKKTDLGSAHSNRSFGC